MKSNGRVHPRLLNLNESLFPGARASKPIEWPTEQQIEQVAQRLAAVKRRGARSEAEGDYFSSGDLAYQLREIIRATAELFSKSQRSKR